MKPYEIQWRKAIALSVFLHIMLWVSGSYLLFHLHASPPVEERMVEIDVTSGGADQDMPAEPQALPVQPAIPPPEETSEPDVPLPPDAVAIRDELADSIPVPVSAIKADPGAANAPIVMRSGGKHSGMGTPPVVVSRVNPIYPSGVPQSGVKVTVVLRMQILETGLPGNVVVAVPGPKSLNDAAIAAVKQWRFQPARDHEGNPMVCSTIIAIPFGLN